MDTVSCYFPVFGPGLIEAAHRIVASFFEVSGYFPVFGPGLIEAPRLRLPQGPLFSISRSSDRASLKHRHGLIGQGRSIVSLFPGLRTGPH